MKRESGVRNYFSQLTKNQRETVGLLSIGTFLEYFDLMLYVHMAVVLNELFFPATDAFTASLITAFAFCSTFVLRPFGALIFGYIGDTVGRKTVVVLTTMLMAVSSLIVAFLPTYAQIGITASWVITLCRMVQSASATAEGTGAELYLTESSKPPLQYTLVSSMSVFSALGGTFALGIATIAMNEDIFKNSMGVSSWRLAFLIGAGIALVGTIARSSLKEADEFSDKKKQLEARFAENKIKGSELSDEFLKEKSPFRTSLAYFLIQCARPPGFYFVYIYCAELLKNECGYTMNEIIFDNFIVSIVDLVGLMAVTLLSYYFAPLKIIKSKLFLFFTMILFFPIVLSIVSITDKGNWILLFQCLAALLVFDHIPASPIFYKYFPIFKRFTYTSLLTAFAKLGTYSIASFGLVYATDLLGYWGIFTIFVPAGIAFYFSVNYFQKLENAQKS
jgi:MHS family proline/betaine transporter-like MFS transporter